MSKQLLIAVSREFGSGGRYIATELARRFQLPLYDKNLLDDIAEERGLDPNALLPYDEAPKKFGSSDSLYRAQSDFLLEKASDGESFVVLGRCGEEVLRDFPELISIFVLADVPFRLARVMEEEGLDEDAALELIAKTDRRRKYYHNQHCRGKWGDSRNYDVCIKSHQLGLEKTIQLLDDYIQARHDNY